MNLCADETDGLNVLTSVFVLSIKFLDSASPALYMAQGDNTEMKVPATRRSQLLMLLVSYLLLSLFAASASVPAQDLPKLTVAYSTRSIAPVDYFIGEQHGLFKAEGLDVRLVQIRASVAVIAMLASEVEVLGSISTASAPLREVRR